jgi:hypothetical protein
MFSPNTRWIDVFMEEKSFNEDNLKKLFAYVSGKNVGPKNLTVMVYTHWEQLPLKLDCSEVVIVHPPQKPAVPNYHKAIYHRKIGSPTREYFVYSTDLAPQSPKFRTVGLQGVKSSDEGHIW